MADKVLVVDDDKTILTMLHKALKSNGIENDLAISDFITSEEYAIAIRKGRPDLLKAINDTIAECKADGRLQKWIEQYTAEADSLKGQ
jgi:ABC-type amino acid transport substrate-binding protein